MRETEPSTATTPRRRRSRLGNRALLATALAATLAAAACFGLLQASAATTAAPASAALAANEVSGTQANAASNAKPASSAAAVGQAAVNQAAVNQASGTQAEPAAASTSVKVQIKGYAFAPAALTVHVGDTVTWTNYDTAPHTVTTSSGPKTISSPQLQTGQSFTYTFTAAGTYQYYCAVHPDMKAAVTVLPTATATPTATAGPTAVPTATASATPTSGMSGMPSSSPTSSTGSDCASVDQVLLPILNHINSAHLGESVGQQVQDALNLDQYIATHTAWIESILTPLTSGGQSVVSSTLTTLLNHINSAHLDESLGQQISDILNPDQYIKTHTVWVSMLLAPTENYLTNNC